MAKANFPWAVTWGKKKRYEDRFSTKSAAEKAAREFKERKEKYGGDVYSNIRIKKVPTKMAKKKYTGLGKSGYGKVLKRKKGESIKSLAKRQSKEFAK